MSAQLAIVHPPGLERRIALTCEDMVFVRGPEPSEIRIDHGTVSRRHFAVCWDADENRHQIADLSSRNGSWLGARPIHQRANGSPCSS